MSEPMYCVNHPGVETYLRCNRCGQPICSKCAVRTPVGYRCRNCISAQQRIFYADFRPVHYLIAAAVALPLALIAGWLIPNLGWYAIILGPLAGGGIASVVRWAVRRRRGRYTWLVVCGSILLGVLFKLLLSFIPLLFILGSAQGSIGDYAMGRAMGLLWDIVYLVTAIGTAYASLRPGRPV